MERDFLLLIKHIRGWLLILFLIVLSVMLLSQPIAYGIEVNSFNNLDLSINQKSVTSYFNNAYISYEFNISLDNSINKKIYFLTTNSEPEFKNDQMLQKNTKSEDSNPQKLDPNVAFKRALFPGIIFHGSGHQYIGESGNGFLLTMTGLGSVALIIVGASELAFDEKSETDSIGDLYTKSDFGFWGINLFMGTWLFDIIAAPIKAKKYNDRHNFIFQLHPSIQNEGVLLTLYIK